MAQEQNLDLDLDNKFDFDQKVNDKVLYTKSQFVLPKMLPSLFRERVKWQQRLYIFMIAIFHAIALGVTAFIMMDNFTEKFHLIQSNQKLYFLIAIVFSYIAIGANFFFVLWSKSRTYLQQPTSVVASIIPPIVFSVALFYLDFAKAPISPSKAANEVFMIIGFAVAGGIVISALIVLITNLIKSKIYRSTKFRTFWTIPGVLAIALAPLLIWLFAKDRHFTSFAIEKIMFSIIVLIAGIALLSIGVTLSNRFKPNVVKSVSSSIKLSSSLTSLMIFVVILFISFRFIRQINAAYPLIVVLLVDLVAIACFGAFLWFKGRVKNIAKTNPLFNEFVIRMLIIFICIIGVIFIAIIPLAVQVKSVTGISYGILTITAFAILIVITGAHFMNLIVFDKFIKSMIATTVIALALIMSSIFVIATLPQSRIIMDVTSRTICIACIVVALIAEIAMFVIEITAIQSNLISYDMHEKQKKKKEAKEKANKARLAATSQTVRHPVGDSKS